MLSRVRPKVPNHMIFYNYLSRVILIIFGYLSELLNLFGFRRIYSTEVNREGYTPLYDWFFGFYYRHIFSRVWEGWGFPISSIAAEKITVLERRTIKEYNFQIRSVEISNNELSFYDF